MIETIHMYHTNDLHSHFHHWPRIRQLITSRKHWHEEAGEDCFLFDIGDHVDRSHPFTDATIGKGNVRLLNEAGFDAITIGNNEGITMHHDELSSLYEEAKFEVIVANLFEKDGTRPTWLKPYTILTTKAGTKIGVIGATAPFTPFYERLGWRIESPKEELIQIVHEIHDKTDIIVFLSHLGIHEDELLAAECPEIDVIFGAHTHHVLHEGKQIGHTLLTGAGKFGFYTGHVILEFNHKSRQIMKRSAVLYDSNDLDPAIGEEQFEKQLVEESKQILSHPLFRNDNELKKEWFNDSLLSSLFGQSLLTYTNADCALFNAGIFLDDLPNGDVTAFDIHRMLPHPINVCVVELTGAELKEAYIQSLNPDWPNIEIKGLGFRGVVMGKIIHANMLIDEE